MKFKTEIKKKIIELKHRVKEAKQNTLLVLEGKLRAQIEVLNWVLSDSK